MTGKKFQESIIETKDTSCAANYCNCIPNIYLLNSILGMSGEVGELSEYIQKKLFHEPNSKPRVYDKDKGFQENITLQLGDIMWYVAECCNVLGISLDDVMKNNIKKLKERHPNGYTNEYKEYEKVR